MLRSACTLQAFWLVVTAHSLSHFEKEIYTFTLNVCVCAKLCQLCLNLCDPVDCSSPDPSVHGILQAIVLESIAISPSGGPSKTRD